jgi:hypothetical protein
MIVVPLVSVMRLINLVRFIGFNHQSGGTAHEPSADVRRRALVVARNILVDRSREWVHVFSFSPRALRGEFGGWAQTSLNRSWPFDSVRV